MKQSIVKKYKYILGDGKIHSDRNEPILVYLDHLIDIVTIIYIIIVVFSLGIKFINQIVPYFSLTLSY